jgi:hypothetical protein
MGTQPFQPASCSPACQCCPLLVLDSLPTLAAPCQLGMQLAASTQAPATAVAATTLVAEPPHARYCCRPVARCSSGSLAATGATAPTSAGGPHDLGLGEHQTLGPRCHSFLVPQGLTANRCSPRSLQSHGSGSGVTAPSGPLQASPRPGEAAAPAATGSAMVQPRALLRSTSSASARASLTHKPRGVLLGAARGQEGQSEAAAEAAAGGVEVELLSMRMRMSAMLSNRFVSMYEGIHVPTGKAGGGVRAMRSAGTRQGSGSRPPSGCR